MAPSRWRGSLYARFHFFLAVGTPRRASNGAGASIGLAGAPAVVIFVGARSSSPTRPAASSCAPAPHSPGYAGPARTWTRSSRRSRAPSRPRARARTARSAGWRQGASTARAWCSAWTCPSSASSPASSCSSSSRRWCSAPSAGFGSNAVLMGVVILGAVKMGALLVFTLVVDRYGRKVLFMVGGVQMIIAQVRPTVPRKMCSP